MKSKENPITQMKVNNNIIVLIPVIFL